MQAADLIQEYEAKIAALERMVGLQSEQFDYGIVPALRPGATGDATSRSVARRGCLKGRGTN